MPASGRRGVTLLELLVVLSITGILTAVAAARFGSGVLGDVASDSQTRRLSLDLLRVQRAAVMTGDNHYVAFTLSGSQATGYQLFRRLSGGGVAAVDVPRVFSDKLTVTVSHTELEYTFEGQALAAYQVTVAGPNRSSQLTVVPLTGAVRVSES